MKTFEPPIQPREEFIARLRQRNNGNPLGLEAIEKSLGLRVLTGWDRDMQDLIEERSLRCN